MTAALGTLPFIATLWLLVVLGARALEESGAKIVAALKGVPPQQPLRARNARRHNLPQVRRVTPANAEWRAAA
jgi:hypothetical protein